jgi:TolA-binding protein
LTQNQRAPIRFAVAAILLIAASGCRSGAGWNPFAKRSAPPAQTAAQAPPATNSQSPTTDPSSAAGQGVVQASYQQPQYVPTTGVTPADLIANENLEEATGQKKTLLESTTESLAPEKIGKGLKKLVGRGPDELLAKSKYEEGQALFRQGKYREAAKCFYVAADRWPDSRLEEDAMYWLAESYFFDDRYKSANDAYGALIKKYDNTSYLVDIVPKQFRIARYWDLSARKDSHWYPNLTDKTRPMVDATGYAIKAYNDVHLHDPRGPLADDAIMAIANSHFLHNRFEDAATYYEQYRKEFSDCEYIKQAHLLGIRAKLRCYQGPQYEVSPLDDADKLIDVTLTQFPAEELGADRERLLATKQLIRIERGQREFQSGEYYYKIHYYGAAQYYYRETIRQFADTPFAKMAEERIEETKNYPPVPYDYFAWLKKVLPESDKGL